MIPRRKKYEKETKPETGFLPGSQLGIDFFHGLPQYKSIGSRNHSSCVKPAAELPTTGSEAEIRESVTEKPYVSTGDTAQQAFLRSKYAAWVENEAGPVKVKIPLRMSTSRGVSLETEEGKIELIPTSGNFKKPSVSGNAIRFNDVYENVDFQYTVQKNTVKGDIFLLEPGDRYEFFYRLKISGMTAKQEKDKVSVYGKDETKALFQLDAPYMEDDSGERSEKVKLSLSGTRGNYQIIIKADKKWLKDEDRSYPVRIDPDTFATLGVRYK